MRQFLKSGCGSTNYEDVDRDYNSMHMGGVLSKVNWFGSEVYTVRPFDDPSYIIIENMLKFNDYLLSIINSDPKTKNTLSLKQFLEHYGITNLIKIPKKVFKAKTNYMSGISSDIDIFEQIIGKILGLYHIKIKNFLIDKKQHDKNPKDYELKRVFRRRGAELITWFHLVNQFLAGYQQGSSTRFQEYVKFAESLDRSFELDSDYFKNFSSHAWTSYGRVAIYHSVEIFGERETVKKMKLSKDQIPNIVRSFKITDEKSQDYGKPDFVKMTGIRAKEFGNEYAISFDSKDIIRFMHAYEMKESLLRDKGKKLKTTKRVCESLFPEILTA